MDRVFGSKRAILFFTMPALLLFLFIVIVPLFVSGYYSLLQWDGIGKSSFIGVKNYVDLLIRDNDGFRPALLNSFILAGLSVFVQLPVALVLALVLANGTKGEGFFRSAFFVPVIISTSVIAQLWMKIYNPQFGLLNLILEQMGLSSLKGEWLGSAETALVAVFIPVVWQYIGYHMLLMYASAKQIPDEIYEAARIDGASGISMAIKITVPLMKPIIKVCVTFAVIGSLRNFDLIYLLTNGGPVHATEVPATLMFNTIFHKYMYGYGSAMAIFIIVECLVFTVLIGKIIKTEQYTY